MCFWLNIQGKHFKIVILHFMTFFHSQKRWAKIKTPVYVYKFNANFPLLTYCHMEDTAGRASRSDEEKDNVIRY